MIIPVQLELLLRGLNALPSVKKWIDRRRKKQATPAGIVPSTGLTADSDVHSLLTGLHHCCHSPQRKQVGCQFPTGNVVILGKKCWKGRDVKQHCRPLHCPRVGHIVGGRCCFCSPHS